LIDQQQQNSSTHALDQLRAATGNVETIGQETVNGAAATHYRTELDYAALADSTKGLSDAQVQAMKKLGRVPMDVWIDGEDRVVKMVFAMGGTALGDAGTSVTMTMEITGFGEPLDVVAPPADQTMSLSAFKALRDTVGA
jgi:hypothetical protein